MANAVTRALLILGYVYPAAVFCVFAFSWLACSCRRRERALADHRCDGDRRRRSIIFALCLLLTTYCAQILAILARPTAAQKPTPKDTAVVTPLYCILVFGLQICRLLELNHVTSSSFWPSWTLALAFEASILSLTAAQHFKSSLDTCDVLVFALMSLRCLSLLYLTASSLSPHGTGRHGPTSDDERQALLRDPRQTRPRNAMAGPSVTDADIDEPDGENEYSWETRQRECQNMMEKRLNEDGTWFSYLKGFSVRSKCAQKGPLLPQTR